MSEQGNEKMEWGLCVAKENVKQGAGGEMARENMELQKLAMILVLYDTMVLCWCQNWCCAEMILFYVKLTFKSAQETDTIWKLAETDSKSALRLPKWVTIMMAKEKL